VELSGRTVRDANRPDGDIALNITGLRPGEKLYEELLIGDNAEPTPHPRVMKAHEDCPSWVEIKRMFEQLEAALDDNDVPRVKQVLGFMLPGYQPHAEVVDWVHVEKAKRAARPVFGAVDRQGVVLADDDRDAEEATEAALPI